MSQNIEMELKMHFQMNNYILNPFYLHYKKYLCIHNIFIINSSIDLGFKCTN